jgi:DnaK suppressor protein
MARTLAPNTVKKFRDQLESERARLTDLIAEQQQELEEARMTESSADRDPDPTNAESASMKFEYAKELSLERNSLDLLHKVEHALARIEQGEYGVCESCGESIPVARLEVLPYATKCVSCAART